MAGIDWAYNFHGWELKEVILVSNEGAYEKRIVWQGQSNSTRGTRFDWNCPVCERRNNDGIQCRNPVPAGSPCSGCRAHGLSAKGLDAQCGDSRQCQRCEPAGG